MTDKVKKKIEAMANKRLEMFWDIKTMNNKQCAEMLADYEDGATPWAEWCERFEKKLKRLKQINIPINVYDRRQMIDEILKEYRQWLKEK